MTEIIDEAVISLGLDNNLTEPLARAVEEAKAEVAALGRTKAKIQVDADTEKARAELKLLQKELDSAAARQKAYQKLVDTSEGAKKGGYASALKNATAQADAARQEVKNQRDIVQAYQQKGRVIQLVGRDIQKTLQDEAKAQKEATAAVKDAKKAAEDAATADLKRSQAIQKTINLQRQYAESQKRVNELSKAFSRAQGSDKIRVKLDTARVLADMEVLREQLKLMNASPIEIKTKVETTGGKVSSFLKNITGGEDPRTLRNIGNEVTDLGNKLKGARVNVGPFSTSLYGVLAAGTALAPMLTGIVGALGSLVAVTGAGLAGGIGIGAAAMTGFGLATLGVVSVVKPFVTQLTRAHAFQTTLNTAIDKYGKGSKQATAAQKIFNNEMKGVSPLVKDTITGFQDLSDKWKQATTAVGNRDLGKIIGQGFQTAKADMGFFAADTNRAFNGITTGVTHLFQQLRGEDKAPLSNIFGNFDKSIGPVFSGINHLADAFLRITSSFSNFLPGLGRGFNDWAKGIDNAAKKSDGFASGVKTMVSSFRDLGHFVQAAGSFLLTFFKAGVGPGAGLLDRMTGSLNRLNKQMSTVSGQQRLTNFFQRSVETTVALWNALMPLVSAFVQFSQATAPVADVMLHVVSEFTKLIALAVSWKPLQLVAGGALGLLAISKLTGTLREAVGLSASLARNIGSFVGAGGGLSNRWAASFGSGGGAMAAAGETLQAAAAAQEAAAGSLEAAAASLEGAAGASRLAAEGGAISTVERAAPAVEGAAVGAVTAGEGAAVGGIAAAAPEAEGAIAGVGGALLDLATGPVGIAVAGIAALAAGVALLGNNSDKSKSALDETRKAVKQGQQNLASGTSNPAFSSGASGQNIGGTSADQLAVNAAARDYYKIVAAGKQNSQAGRAALVAYNDALHQQSTDLSAAKNFQNQVNDSIKKQVDLQSKDQTQAQKGVNDATKAYNEDLKRLNGAYGQDAVSRKKAADDLKNLHAAQNNLNTVNQQALRLANQNATAKLNEQRQLTGLVPVSARYAQSVGQLTRELAGAGPAGAAALKQLTNIPDPSKVSGLARAFNSLTAATDKTKAIKIIADTSNPEQAIAKLNGLQLKEKVLKLLQNGSDNVIAAITKVNGRPLPAKVLRLLGNAQDALSKHQQVTALRDVQKALRILGDDGSALAAIGAVNGALNSLPSSKTVAINTVYTSIFKTVGNSPRGALGGAAAGGQVGFLGGVTPALAAVQTRAARIAQAKPTKRTQGGLYGSPTYLVGEENRPEFVISTNPAYRQQNKQYLRQAASMFGGTVQGFATGRGNETAARKPKPKKKPKDEFVFGGLSAADRIGGIGVDDINTKISAQQSNVSSDNSKISTYNSRIRSDQSTIDRVNKIPAKKRTANEKADLVTKQKDLSTQHRNLKGAQNKLTRDKDSLKRTNAILTEANKYITQFSSLENNIASVGSLMNAAEASPSDRSAGVNPKNEKMETHTWGQWRSILEGLEKNHTSLLKKAWADAKKRAGKNPDALHTSYVTQLAAALGQSISDEASLEAATDANATDVSQPTPESMADFLTLIKYGSQPGDQALASLETQQNLDQIGALQNPGNPAYLQAQINDANNLIAFYQNVYGQARGWTNPTYPGGLRPDPALLQDVTGALLQATQDAQGIQASAQGPSQAQLTSTALSDLYTNFGGNTAGLILGAAMGMSPTSMANALAGGEVAQAALTGNARAAAVPAAGGAATAGAAATGHTIIQNNNFSQPPDDPHHWSKGIEWELGALA